MTISGAHEADGDAISIVSHTRIPNLQFRVVAITNEGRELEGMGSILGAGNMVTRECRFKAPLSDLRKVRVEIRPYRWIVVRDVSLVAGKKTNAKAQLEPLEDQLATFLPAFDSYMAKVTASIKKKTASIKKKTLGIGDQAPDFEIRTLSGETVRLADYRGKYVLLDFWATWCTPCLKEIPNLKAVYDKFGSSERFAMISLSLDSDAALAKN